MPEIKTVALVFGKLGDIIRVKFEDKVEILWFDGTDVEVKSLDVLKNKFWRG